MGCDIGDERVVWAEVGTCDGSGGVSGANTVMEICWCGSMLFVRRHVWIWCESGLPEESLT
jgi:hypothetical protein